MKKILLGTTAVVALATMSTEAFAADKIKLELGGFMRHYIGLSNHDEVAAGQQATVAGGSATRAIKLQQSSNTEVYFRGSTTLDNGLKVSADIQMEADKSQARRTDVSSLSVSSDAMGALTVGSTAHAGDDMLVRVPNAGNHDWGDTDKFGGVSDAAATNTAGFSTVASDITDMGGKDGKIKYVTPTFSGFTGYASYSAGEGSNSDLTVGGFNGASSGAINRSAAQDGYTYGVAYSGDLAGASVSADLTHANINTAFDVNHFGLNVGMAGFTVGGGYSDFNDTRTARTDEDGNAWELGVAYETGPYSVSAGYMAAKKKDTATVGDSKDTKWNLAATYDLGAGVALTADYFHSKADKEGTGATFANGKSATVSGLIAGIEVGF